MPARKNLILRADKPRAVGTIRDLRENFTGNPAVAITVPPFTSFDRNKVHPQLQLNKFRSGALSGGRERECLNPPNSPTICKRKPLHY